MAFLFYFFIGIGLLVRGLYGFAQKQKAIYNGIAVEAVVTDYEKSTNEDGNAAYSPIFRYSVAGKTYVWFADYSFSDQPFPLGSRQTLYYPAGKLQKCYSPQNQSAIVNIAISALFLFFSFLAWSDFRQYL